MKSQKQNKSSKIITDTILEEYNKRLKENTASHKKKFVNEIEVLNKLIALYFSLPFTIRNANKKDKYPPRFFFCKQYINTVANNFYVIRDLFLKGLHVQFQLVIRGQLEYVNNLIAFVGDDNFYERHCQEINEILITPKPIHSEKAIKRLLKEDQPEDFNEFWLVYKLMADSIYSDLSETAHGNVARVTLQSFGKSTLKKDIYTESKCGVKIPLDATRKILADSLNYFQFTYAVLLKQLNKKNMIKRNNQFYKFTNIEGNKIHIFAFED